MRILFFVTFIIFISVLCSVGSNAEEGEIKFSVNKTAGHAVQGELIVEIKKGVVDLGKESGVVPVKDVIVNSGSLTALNKKYNLVSVERLFSGTRKDGPSDIYVFRFSNAVNINTIISDYKKEENVLYAEPNYVASVK
jgi:hypothetical protein